MNSIKPAIMACMNTILLLVLMHQPIDASDVPGLLSEEYLRSVFAFEVEDQLKYAECEDKTHPTCTYVWGPESKKDAARVKYGLKPDGNKLQVIYAQARSAEDFKRVLATYSDAEIIDGIGEQAVWSEKRKQLSLITNEYLIVHVNIDAKGVEEIKAKAQRIAIHLLDGVTD